MSIPYGVKNIGRNAFKGCNNLKKIYIPATVQEIGENAFAECQSLLDLCIFSYEVDEQKYMDLKATYRCTNGTVYMANSFPEDKIIKNTVRSSAVGPANTITDGISRLFTTKHPNERKERSIYNKRSCYGFGSNSFDISEIDSLKEMIGKSDFGDTDVLSESKNDAFLKGESFPEIKKTAVLTFDDSKTMYENGKYYLLIDIVIGFHFWQSVVPVKSDGKNYFIYRRHFLSSTTNLNYIRKEITVLSEKGENVGSEEVKRVKAKYRLLAIL